MSTLSYSAATPLALENQETYGYSQAVRFGNALYISGQGGWRPDGSIEVDNAAQIALAFQNVDQALISAGGNGLTDVFKVTTFLAPFTDELAVLVSDEIKRRLPHKPLWTCIGVDKLAFPGMVCEVEIIAGLVD
ncbi:Endoribonuclease L-PSP/chorismate mutase-like protein [Naematelia encephala]|uniref:Endoribonuclease L-PSP/chorismate mutase-like protein n=1 Tax=Naematelia encephala TaxID=71784 RepID=A0A1Y2AUA2_9TREE|nr:Endoribonuclease L-PSP/chorismate mutase-like protein [Naematelia encephala]